MGLIPGLGRSLAEGNVSPLQYSDLENPMDRGAWRATVHGVAKTQIRLSDQAQENCGTKSLAGGIQETWRKQTESVSRGTQIPLELSPQLLVRTILTPSATASENEISPWAGWPLQSYGNRPWWYLLQLAPKEWRIWEERGYGSGDCRVWRLLGPICTLSKAVFPGTQGGEGQRICALDVWFSFTVWSRVRAPSSVSTEGILYCA